METTFQFPAATPEDPSDVALAVQTAGALWRQGDSREALKWLRRAAESAETEGDDMRALSLARAAAELKDRLPHLTSVPPPPQSSVPAPVPTRVSAPPSVAPVSASVAPKSQIPPAPSLVSSLTTDLGLGPAKLEAWSPPSSRQAPEAAAPAASAAVVPAAPVLASAPVLAPVVARQSEPEPATPVPVPAAPPDLTPTAPLASLEAPDAHVAVRVSVEILSRGSGTLLVRVLGAGENAPAGAREALLVPLEAGVDLKNL